jgi:LuxR family maltose regulon positive regulatory protein
VPVAGDAATGGGAADGPSVLLESKLRAPVPRPGIISRGRLVDRLTAARRTPVVVVEAPAGYGKTILASEWIAADRRRSAWLTLDEHENEPGSFVDYVAAALERGGDAIGDARTRLAAGEDGCGIMGELCDAWTGLTAPALLVVDDVQRLTNADCLTALATLASRVPGGSQLALLTRSEIPAHLAGGADARPPLHLRGAELRLTDAEAAGVLRGAGLELDDDEAANLNKRCEGWAAVLYLIALAGRPAVERLEDPTAGVDEFVRDYVHLEVLDMLPEDDRRLLCDISLLDRVDAGLCDAMLERTDSAERLARLAAAHLLEEEAEGTSAGYRLHGLVRAMLRSDMLADESARTSAILARASDWYEENDELDAAIETAILLGDRMRVAELVMATGLAPYWHGRLDVMERWLAAIDDPDVLAKQRAVTMTGAVIFAIAGRPETAERWRRIAFAPSDDPLLTDGTPFAGAKASLRAIFCIDGIEVMHLDAREALELLPPDTTAESSALLLLAFATLLRGDEDVASTDLERAAQSSRLTGATINESLAHAAGSLLAAKRNDVAGSRELEQQARAVVEENDLEGYVTTALVETASARVALAHHNWPAAREAAARADALLPNLTYELPWLAAITRIELAHVHLALDEPARARDLLDEIVTILAHRPALGTAVDAAAQLRHDLAVGHSEGGWTSTLTPAEWRLLPLLATHLSFREIAERLNVSRNTVKTQAIAVYRELGVSSRSAAVARGRELGFLKPGGDPPDTLRSPRQEDAPGRPNR